MKLAIHYKGSFSERWIAYCKQKNIPFKVVNCHDSDIIQQIRDCDALMWHHNHSSYEDALAAKPILFALEHARVKVFPDFNTGWHFDDKVAQKYLLEAIDAPLVPSFVFYNKEKALTWIKTTSFPKVFKLKGGAGSTNVRLVRNMKEANKLVKKSFGKGFSQYNKIEYFKDRMRSVKRDKAGIIEILKGIGRMIIPTEFAKMHRREKGYVYFQEFMPNNDSDTRVVVVGNRAAAEKRFVRENDFRASGSGEFSYEGIDEEIVKIAFDVAKRLNVQSAAFDFVYNTDKKPLIVELSYGFGTSGIIKVPGYWTADLKWHEGKFKPQEWMVEELIKVCGI